MKLKVSANGRYFVDQDGKPFFYLGDTAWVLFQRLDHEEAEEYLLDRAKKGFTVIQAYVVRGLDKRHPDGNGSLLGESPFIDRDPTKPNEAYFKNVDYVVTRANELGLVMGLVTAKSWHVNKHPEQVFDAKNAYTFGRFLGERYKNNAVMWYPGGDSKPGSDEAVWVAMAKGLKDGSGGSHLVSYHGSGHTSSSMWFHQADWLDFNSIESGHGWATKTYEFIERDYKLTPPKPTVDMEPPYENHPTGAKTPRIDSHQVRKGAYWNMLAGAAGHGYGALDLFWLYKDNDGPFPRNGFQSWRKAMAYEGSSQMGFVRRLFELRPWYKLVPDQSVIAAGQGEGEDHVQSARAEDGSFVIAYLPKGKPVGIKMDKLSGKTVKAQWYDPRKGTWRLIGEYANTGVREFAAPSQGDKEDWVLVLEDAAKNFSVKLPRFAEDASQDLLSAARKGDATAVEALLNKGADVNAKTDYGATALSFAADKGHVEVVKVLLKHQADINSKDTFYKATPMTWAVYRDRVEVVKLLLENGADGNEAFASAVQKGNVELVRAMLEKGKLKPETLTAALAATPAKRTDIADLLTKAGAKPAPKPDEKETGKALTVFVGTYESDNGTRFQLDLKDGQLVLMFQGKPLYVLNTVDKITFGIVGNDDTKISFRREGDKVVGLVMKAGKDDFTFKRVQPENEKDDVPKLAGTKIEEGPVKVLAPLNWPSFRGPNASGVADGQFPPSTWNAEKGLNVVWKTPIPGFGHSSPAVWEDRIFVTTAISGDPKAKPRVGLYGDVDSVNDKTTHTWKIYCLEKRTGKVLWEQTACSGVPQIKRHMKASHANPTPAADAKHVVASFGSEGLFCYDHTGKLLWKRDLGTLDSGWFYDSDYQWGFGSSPILFRDRVIVQCDIGKNSFIAAYELESGKELWLTRREEIPSWGTPTVVEGPMQIELITNATKFVRGYDPMTGKELWRLARNAEITVPTPVCGQGLIFITSGYRPIQPIYAVRLGALGDISLKEGTESSDHIAWSKTKGGPYMTTPIVYGNYFYVCSNNGLLTCYEAKTGKQVYQKRLGGSDGYTASPVAADGKLYFTGEESEVRVVKAGDKFELLAINPMGDVCMATPAISDGMIFVRTQQFLYGIGRKQVSQAN